MKWLLRTAAVVSVTLIAAEISTAQDAEPENQEPYSIQEELDQYEQEASFEEFQLIDYFGVMDASVSISGEVQPAAASDTAAADSVTSEPLTRENIIRYARTRFNEAFTGVDFQYVPKPKVLEMLNSRDPDRHEVGLILIDVKISAYKKIAALNVTMQAGNLRTVEIWKKTEGEYYLREETDAFSRVKKVIDDLMVQLAIDFYKSRLGIY